MRSIDFIWAGSEADCEYHWQSGGAIVVVLDYKLTNEYDKKLMIKGCLNLTHISNAGKN